MESIDINHTINANYSLVNGKTFFAVFWHQKIIFEHSFCKYTVHFHILAFLLPIFFAKVLFCEKHGTSRYEVICKIGGLKIQGNQQLLANSCQNVCMSANLLKMNFFTGLPQDLPCYKQLALQFFNIFRETILLNASE